MLTVIVYTYAFLDIFATYLQFYTLSITFCRKFVLIRFHSEKLSVIYSPTHKSSALGQGTSCEQ